jgi:hypothetical protein
MLFGPDGKRLGARTAAAARAAPVEPVTPARLADVIAGEPIAAHT